MGSSYGKAPTATGDSLWTKLTLPYLTSMIVVCLFFGETNMCRAYDLYLPFPCVFSPYKNILHMNSWPLFLSCLVPPHNNYDSSIQTIFF